MLKISNLHTSYGGSLILQGIDLKVKRAEIMAIMGRNGMGKTTLMKTIMGLLPPQSGKIELENESIGGLKPHKIAAKGVGFVPQGREIFSDFTVWDNLRLATLRYPRKKRYVPENLFEYFPILKERKNQRAGSFSGGEQQMLAIARALAANPKLLLLDEPSEGIQPSIIQEITRILRAINKETGITIVIVEQNVDMILDLADTCAFLEKGRIADTCPKDALQKDDSMITRYMAL
ncbi:urea ABC transporter ATP-binding subunit UrtE [Desulfococcaceae bacterium HSG7]|nr:urea ABC transporter ATP-binding subunit UrtE [Desulfococcaceae bacterium HSG7]